MEYSMFATPAFAQAADSGIGGLLNPAGIGSILPFVLIFVIMYFLILRPQRTKQRQHQELIANVRRGDTVVTTGGLIGKVAKVVDEGELQIDLAEGVRVRVVRSMISEVRAKGEPVKDNG
jgi:preprotein translocase subunit YajC